jgi:ABC-type lipoprotein export system ATPase subunit
VWKSYDQGRVSVLQDASLEVRAGEVVALWGSSGSGKSTLLHLLGGLDTPDRGELSVCGLDPTLESNRLELRRRHLGFVFQLHNLIPDLTVEENIRIPALALGRPVAETAARVRDLATRVGLQHRLSHRIQDLSGGERQRTAICRALLNAPAVLLADEPTGSLDEATGDSVFALLRALAQHDRITIILATHERRFAEACDRIVRVRDGRLLANL